MLTFYMLVSLICAQGQGCRQYKAPVPHLSFEECIAQRDAAWHEQRPALYDAGRPFPPKRWYKTDCLRELSPQ